MAELGDVLVIGAGAIGCYYGGKLAPGASRVWLQTESRFDSLQQKGIAITSPRGDFGFVPGRIVRPDTPDVPKFDVVVIALNTHANAKLVDRVRPAVGPNTTIVVLQSGINFEQSLGKVFPNNTVVGGITHICVKPIDRGRFAHVEEGRICLGSESPHAGNRLERLAKAWDGAGVPATVRDDICAERWAKFMYTAAYDAIAVLTGRQPQQGNEKTERNSDLVRALTREISAVARASGHPLPDGAIERFMDVRCERPEYLGPLWWDHLRHRPLEIKATFGAALAIAEQHGVAMPSLRTIDALLRLIVARRGPEKA